jgi:DNA-binding transcriptional LysR family regulator
MDTLTSIRVFCTVSELKSFSAAASRLGLSPAMTSKHVMHLENRLGARLLNRTSRHVSLTETGTLYFNQAKQTLDGLDEVEAAVSNVSVIPRGTLRVSAPVFIANQGFARMLAEFQQRYPDVCFDFDLSGRVVNMVDEGFDLALRASRADRLDQGLIARPLLDVQFQLVAAPAYLERAGRPKKLSDLNGHALLMYNGAKLGSTIAFDGPDGKETVKFRTVLESGNESLLHFAAMEGMGMTFLPQLMVESEMAEGELENVLPGTAQFLATMYAVYPSRKFLSAKVRAFIDFLTMKIDQVRREKEEMALQRRRTAA